MITFVCISVCVHAHICMLTCLPTIDVQRSVRVLCALERAYRRVVELHTGPQDDFLSLLVFQRGVFVLVLSLRHQHVHSHTLPWKCDQDLQATTVSSLSLACASLRKGFSRVSLRHLCDLSLRQQYLHPHAVPRNLQASTIS